jgi:hypothetical protein
MHNDGSALRGQGSTDKPPKILGTPAMMATFPLNGRSGIALFP